ncbi:MAG: helix-turn-helix domain-containing protein [Rubrobacter sp.]|nr:helix-turn-helix domain-containing protein [Rubrobacter sp.]
MGRSASTVSREVGRHGGRGSYRALKADERAWERAQRPERCMLAENERLRGAVAEKLRMDWSPQQISGWLVRHCPDDEAMRVSQETIYRTLVRPGQRRFEEGAARPSAKRADDAPGSVRLHTRPAARADQGSRLHPPEAEDRTVPGR